MPFIEKANVVILHRYMYMIGLFGDSSRQHTPELSIVRTLLTKNNNTCIKILEDSL